MKEYTIIPASVTGALTAAKAWEAKNDSSWAYANYLSHVRGLLSLSLTSADTPGEGVDLFVARQGVESLEKCLFHLERLVASVKSKSFPASVIGGGYDIALCLQIEILLKRFDIEMRFLDFLCVEEIYSEESKFLRQYYDALDSFVRKKPFSALNIKWTGYEKYWTYYLVFISDVTNGRDPSASVAKMAAGFKARNADKRLVERGLPIDGSGRVPVKWDFWGESLKKYATEAYGLTL